MKRTMIALLATLLALLTPAGIALAQEEGPRLPEAGPNAVRSTIGTAFTYQGYLEDTAGPITGAVDFTFTLWDDPTASGAGNQIGGAAALTGVLVDEGLFTAELDFGSGAFGGGARYLEITVNGTVLSPRQSMTPSPVALALPGLYTDESLPFVGVGRDSPIESREAFGVDAPGDGRGGMYVNTTDPGAWAFYGYANEGQLKAYHYYQPTTNAWVLRFGITDQLWVKQDGRVGMGTPAPSERLEVIGSVKTSDGLKVSAGVFNGVLVESANQAGVRVDVAGTDGVHVNSATEDGLSVNYAGGDGLSVSTADGNGVFIDQPAGDGVQVASALDDGVQVGNTVADGVRVVNPGAHGIHVETAGQDGIHVADAGNTGVYARTTDSEDYGGEFVNDGANTSVPQGGGLYTRSQGDLVPDLVLGGNSGTDDDGRISTDPNYVSGDLVFASDDDVTVMLDIGGGDEDSDFQIQDESGSPVFNVDDSGALWQPVGQLGLAKAAAFGRCDGSDSGLIHGQSVYGTTISFLTDSDDDSCAVNFGFPLTGRYWIATVTDQLPSSTGLRRLGYVNCWPDGAQQLYCTITDTSDFPEDAEDIMIVVF